MQLIIL